MEGVEGLDRGGGERDMCVHPRRRSFIRAYVFRVTKGNDGDDERVRKDQVVAFSQGRLDLRLTFRLQCFDCSAATMKALAFFPLNLTDRCYLFAACQLSWQIYNIVYPAKLLSY